MTNLTYVLQTGGGSGKTYAKIQDLRAFESKMFCGILTRVIMQRDSAIYNACNLIWGTVIFRFYVHVILICGELQLLMRELSLAEAYLFIEFKIQSCFMSCMKIASRTFYFCIK